MEKKEYFDGDYRILLILEKDGIREDVWTNDGHHALNPKFYEKMSDEEIIDYLKKHPKPCTHCNKDLEEGFFSAFATKLCDFCAKVFKEKHSDICRNCKKPIYACHC